MTLESRGRIAYFSMEIALRSDIPTYSGGLGILAGDTLRSAADANMPTVGITLLYRKGYFDQHLDLVGNQSESASSWKPEEVLERTEVSGSITLEGRKVSVRAWRFSIQGLSGSIVPVYLLDTALPENSAFDQTLTDQLYGGDARYRLCQEAILGIGGMEILGCLGLKDNASFHMNEGHSSLLTVDLLERHLAARSAEKPTTQDFDYLRKKCIFTTHTPVPAGHDQFSKHLVHRILGDSRLALLEDMGCFVGDTLNMTLVGLRGSHYINGVAMQHGEVSRGMFPNYPIRAITNGVHATTWTSPSFRQLYDRHIPEWRRDNLYLRYAIGIPPTEIRDAHIASKRMLLNQVQQVAGVKLDENILTIGFARRAATYKRADLLFSNLETLKRISRQVGPFQLIYGGKAHPHDEDGKAVIRRIFQVIAELRGIIPIVYIENYDLRWGQLLTSGSDLWLNTPHRPYEASGTSGMKAALNGVPSFSVPDGWWREGHVEGVTGWGIGRDEIADTPEIEIADLYHKLATLVLPMFYGSSNAYAEMMRFAIALNGSFFNTQRMLAQYALDAYSTPDPVIP